MNINPAVIPTTRTIWLQYNNSKFWEISIFQEFLTYKTLTRFGVLKDDGSEDPRSLLTVIRPHASIEDANNYFDDCIANKREKGYRNPKKLLDVCIEPLSVASPQDYLGKRAAEEDPDSPHLKTKKKIHLNEDIETKDTPTSSVSPSSFDEEVIDEIDDEADDEASSAGSVISIDNRFKSLQKEEEEKGWSHFLKEKYAKKPNCKIEYTKKEESELSSKKTWSNSTSNKEDRQNKTVSREESELSYVFSEGEPDEKSKSNVMDDDLSDKSETITETETVRCKIKLPSPNSYNGNDPKGYYMAQRYGGFRCFWDGYNLFSKNGTKYEPPKNFLQHFPKFPLDGILFSKTGEMVLNTVKKTTKYDLEKKWADVMFRVYDMPDDNNTLTFKQRLKRLKEYFSEKPKDFIQLAKYKKCKSREHLEEKLRKIQDKGGEGMILKNKDSLYDVKGKNKGFIEIISEFKKDAKVLECNYEYKDGQYILKSLLVENIDNHQSFKIYKGLKDIQKKPPEFGSVIEYKYHSEIKGKPNFPVFVAVKKVNLKREIS